MKRGHMRLLRFANLPVFIEHKNTWIGCIRMQVVLDASFFWTGDGVDSFDFSAVKNFLVRLGDSPWGRSDPALPDRKRGRCRAPG